MAKIALYNMDGKRIEDVELTLRPISEPTVYEAVKNYLTNQRQGTVSTKTRAEVSGSGTKPWKQKGTGRARAGSKRTPIWRGGGVVFGPKPRNLKIRLSPLIKRKALSSVITDKTMSNELVIIDSLIMDQPKTSKMIEILKNLGMDRPLVVVEETDRNVALSLRNIKGCHLVQADNLNAYQVLSHSQLLMTKGALQRLEERLKDA